MAKVRKVYEDESRKRYGIDIEEELGLDRDQLKVGCLQRIANALERIANVAECGNARAAALAIVRMDKRMGKRTKL